MPLLLKIDNKRLWEKFPWLPAGEVPANALQGFKLDENNELSVWFVDTDGTNLERVIAALAANRDFIQKLDYALIDENAVDRVGIARRKTVGQTPDVEAAKEWHWDLVELTGRKIVFLAELIGTDSPKRAPLGKVKELLGAAAKEGRLRKDLVPNALSNELQWPQA